MSSGHNNKVERRDFLKGLGVAAGGAIAVGSASAIINGRPVALGNHEGSSLPEHETAQAPAANVTVPATGTAAEHQEAEAAPSPELEAFFGELRPGTQVGRWRVAGIHGVRNGAVPVTMATENGATFQVDVFRRDAHEDAVNGVGNTASLSIFVVNGGDGSTATDEECGLGALALATALAGRESSGATAPELLTWRERARRFPRGAFRVG